MLKPDKQKLIALLSKQGINPVQICWVRDLEADRICEDISRKQAMREELADHNVTNESVGDSVATDTVDIVAVP